MVLFIVCFDSVVWFIICFAFYELRSVDIFVQEQEECLAFELCPAQGVVLHLLLLEPWS
mgnify:CR=1 FL=1